MPAIQYVQAVPSGRPRGNREDCVTRAISLAANIPYHVVADAIADGAKRERPRGSGERSSVSHGVFTSRVWFKRYMQSLGFTWTPTMGIGTGCTVHLRADELPMGHLVVMVSRHACAVIDRVLYDNHNSSRNGTRCVYGYWHSPR
jgi:hypothetical protein